MARWKLSRQTFGNEEFSFVEGQEITIGRGLDNTLTLKSIVVSRNHCVINFQREQVLITDLKSSNGIYVGLKKIPQNMPYILKDSDVIGFGWTEGAPVKDIDDKEKFIFKLLKEESLCVLNRIKFQSDDEIETKIAVLDNNNSTDTSSNLQSPVLKKQKPNESPIDVKIKTEPSEIVRKSRIVTIDDDVIDILSDSENESEEQQQITLAKKVKVEPNNLEAQIKTVMEEPIMIEQKDAEYEAFVVKQEYLGYDDQPIEIDSDDDSECETWMLRLSQSSPGKPFTKIKKENKIDTTLEESSYSQLDDFITDNEDYIDDLISIPPQPPEQVISSSSLPNVDTSNKTEEKHDLPNKEFVDDLIPRQKPDHIGKSLRYASKICEETNTDEVDGTITNYKQEDLDVNKTSVLETQKDKIKKTQMIQPLVLKRKSSTNIVGENKQKNYSPKKSKTQKHPSSKRNISNSQKEERKKKLKEIASKEKEEIKIKSDKQSSLKMDKPLVNAKVTTSNRGAFLTDVAQAIVKPIKGKETTQNTTKKNDAVGETSLKYTSKAKHSEKVEDIENKNKLSDKTKSETQKSCKHKDKCNNSKSKETSITSNITESRVPLKSLKPLSESEGTFSGKPFSLVEPLPSTKPKKKVRFSEAGPTIRVFEIQEGHKLRKTSSVKTTLVDVRHLPVMSLEKITLMKILRWNPHWLEEQMNNNDPPPILGSHPPISIFHSFSNHNQYVQLVGDLLLMEIWECLTQGHMRIRNQTNFLQMRIESLPPVPSQDRFLELFNLSVNLSVPNSELKTVPRTGEVMLITFGPENARNRRFFFVNNVRTLPSPPKNVYSFFSISLQAAYTDKIKSLRPGEVVLGQTLAFIKNELMLFNAMEYLAGSPLSEAILRPEPRHFLKIYPSKAHNINSYWTKTLNPSQIMAVNSSVAAALGDKPCIQMVQGPPGTGKSSVVCAIVMSYFYDSQLKKQQNRGKILICATSNAAVDDLVIRLLKIRQDLPKAERFRMVRVGRAESMHQQAHAVSSQELAKRDASRLNTDCVHPGVSEEISQLEARFNMWKSQALEAKNPERVAYCQNRADDIAKRILLLRGDNKELRGDRLMQVERRIIEGADIIVTTLASAGNVKMKGLKRRIALCIVDEAGQAIEPETLIPLTLDVTRLTLIGDPQQLPGYICSQRAKNYGLGESLFSRISSCAEHWPEGSPIIFLNEQYRMHSDIADYPNRAFYDGKINTISLNRPPLSIPPYAIVRITSGDKGQGISGANEIEAWGVTRLVLALSNMIRSLKLSLAVITPYNAHKDLIKKNLKMLQDHPEDHIEVNTVDSFQGQERDVVVVSLARSQGVGFLTDTGRMNVMLTRAKHALLVCLNPSAMLKNQQWRTLVEDAMYRNLYRELPNKFCQGPSAGPIPSEDILKCISYQK